VKRSIVLFVLFTTALAGCEWTKSSQNGPGPKNFAGPLGKPKAPELVGYLNAQANAVRTLSYSDVRLNASENGRSLPALSDSTLYAAQPRYFRLECGTLATSQELDLGSNDREFWVYAKRMDSPNFFYCKHADYDRGTAQFPVPFDPDWVMMALGMAPYDPNANYEVEHNTREGAYVLKQNAKTRQGQPIQRWTVMNADWDQGRRPVVRGHIIRDASGAKICTAEIKSVKTLQTPVDPATGKTGFVQVPTQVVLEWTQQKFVMDLKLSGEKLNEDLSQQQAALFGRPRIPGSQPIDLAQYQFAPTARGQAGRR
jgi:hypothetical protein